MVSAQDHIYNVKYQAHPVLVKSRSNELFVSLSCRCPEPRVGLLETPPRLQVTIYCHVPAGWGLQQTTRAPGSDKTWGQGSFGPFTGGLNLRRTDCTLVPFY